MNRDGDMMVSKQKSVLIRLQIAGRAVDESWDSFRVPAGETMEFKRRRVLEHVQASMTRVYSCWLYTYCFIAEDVKDCSKQGYSRLDTILLPIVSN